jgi:hypothetical protein
VKDVDVKSFYSLGIQVSTDFMNNSGVWIIHGPRYPQIQDVGS